MDKASYQRLVRKLCYLSHTRPDIVSQFMPGPWERHLQRVSRTIQYLKAGPGKRVPFSKE